MRHSDVWLDLRSSEPSSTKSRGWNERSPFLCLTTPGQSGHPGSRLIVHLMSIRHPITVVARYTVVEGCTSAGSLYLHRFPCSADILLLRADEHAPWYVLGSLGVLLV